MDNPIWITSIPTIFPATNIAQGAYGVPSTITSKTPYKAGAAGAAGLGSMGVGWALGEAGHLEAEHCWGSSVSDSGTDEIGGAAESSKQQQLWQRVATGQQAQSAAAPHAARFLGDPASIWHNDPA